MKVEKRKNKDTLKQVKNLVQACFQVEGTEDNSIKGKDFNKNVFLEDLRQEKLMETVELMRDIEYAEDANKLKSLYMYKVMSQQDYEDEAREIRREYQSGILDPRREVARIEKGGAKRKAH